LMRLVEDQHTNLRISEHRGVEKKTGGAKRLALPHKRDVAISV